MTDTDTDIDADQTGSRGQEQSVEQIEATFGPMTAFVSGTDSDEVYDRFEDVWATLLETQQDMRDDQRERESGDDSIPSTGVR